MNFRKPLAYLSAVRAEIRSLGHFRANVVAWLLYSPLQLAITYLLWTVVYRKTDHVGSFDFQEMIQYYLLVHFLRKVIEPVQTINYQVWSEINKGSLDVYLARPLSFGLFTFFKSLGTPLLELLIGLPFLALFSLVLGVPLAPEPGVLALFLSSVLAGYVVLFLIQFIIGSLTFWLERIFGVRDMIFSVFMLFSGQLIPVSVLPEWIGQTSRYLPFESIYYVPATIYAGRQSMQELSLLHLQQLLWVGALLLVANVVWSRGIARYASQGG